MMGDEKFEDFDPGDLFGQDAADLTSSDAEGTLTPFSPGDDSSLEDWLWAPEVSSPHEVAVQPAASGLPPWPAVDLSPPAAALDKCRSYPCSIPGCPHPAPQRPISIPKERKPVRFCTYHMKERPPLALTVEGERRIYRVCAKGHHMVLVEQFEASLTTCMHCRAPVIAVTLAADKSISSLAPNSVMVPMPATRGDMYNTAVDLFIADNGAHLLSISAENVALHRGNRYTITLPTTGTWLAWVSPGTPKFECSIRWSTADGPHDADPAIVFRVDHPHRAPPPKRAVVADMHRSAKRRRQAASASVDTPESATSGASSGAEGDNTSDDGSEYADFIAHISSAGITGPEAELWSTWRLTYETCRIRRASVPAAINRIRGYDGHSLLSLAAAINSVELVRQLLQWGADPLHESNEGTPLELAQSSAVKELLNAAVAATEAAAAAAPSTSSPSASAVSVRPVGVTVDRPQAPASVSSGTVAAVPVSIRPNGFTPSPTISDVDSFCE